MVYLSRCVGLIMVLLLGTVHAHAQAPALRLMSEEFPPINFSQDGEAQGLAVDMVREIQRRLGQKQAIEFLPWARAFRDLQRPAPAALFAMARTPERERQFKWVGPIVVFYSAIYAPAGGGVRLRSLDDAKKAAGVLVVRDWYVSEHLSALGFTNLVRVSDPTQGIRMLLARRAPLFATERISMPQTLSQAGLAEDALEIVYSYASADGYIAFSRGTPDAVVRAWQQQLDRMKRDGSFQTIYKRWLPADSPPG
ncbi:transporter substrate-binding domain-containing protein [Paucibacter sp. PLA-PC-4]|uniref:substrate-binding periplasmic protein n=1 Tax=Paucibacter sp. PLA-PC-4 TaxID=2993655 RepID=UPI0022493D0B|nr:transporter substrate-binding domain-containing protein [Paucibacter sp. PLA-PC-4]MCX2861629.1 transporter substrate-binding domain-containing protein [Paucibacter sp. PLA-PC-4]